MRLVLTGLLALVLGVAGGTGFVLLRQADPGEGGTESGVVRAADRAALEPAESPLRLPVPEDTSVVDLEEMPTAGSSEADPPLPGGDPFSLVRAALQADRDTRPTELVLPAAGAVPEQEPTTPVAGDGAASRRPTRGAPPPDDGSRRLARIFSAMKPQEAAAVLERMEDDEVRAVLVQLGDRPAAQILGSFEPDRAARLSRGVLEGRRTP